MNLTNDQRNVRLADYVICCLLVWNGLIDAWIDWMNEWINEWIDNRMIWVDGKTLNVNYDIAVRLQTLWRVYILYIILIYYTLP